MQLSKASSPDTPPRTIKLDTRGRVTVPLGAASIAALLRLGLGLLYLWAFISQGFGVVYSNSVTSAAGKVVSYGWMLALRGLGVTLTLGIAMRIAGWGGFVLNIVLWFSLFPPSGNPVIDGEHMAFAFSILLLAFLHAGNWFGLGRWWEKHTPALIH